MRQSALFTRTRRDAPSDETAKNAQLLIRAGYVHKEMAGVYSYLPLGTRVLQNIENIVRSAMNFVDGQEIRMATLHPSEPWKQTGGWDNIDVLFKINSRTEREYALGQSEEEIVTPIGKEYAVSYKDLPMSVYQIGQKYRDELRAKSGIMRGREFTMKDMYSFHATQEDFDTYYERVKEIYLQIFSLCGLTARVTEASGGSFTEKLSYEFMVLTDAGEDDILYCTECTHCVNVEVAKDKEGDTCMKCEKGTMQAAKAAEVANVFDLGQKYAKDFDFTFKDAEGNDQYPIMGCYGIGITRLMGVIAEALSDDKGLVWPHTVAPFKFHLVSLAGGNKEVEEYAEKLYEDISKLGVPVLYDDRELHAGEKFADADLIGIPVKIIVGKKTLESGQLEIVARGSGKVDMVSREQFFGTEA
ncbi:MAG TPA: aminoacyl--tRNA ligase-related protein [Candidatus Paceibacterota bacterium]|nr:aminoacyl--tRNA ligase-related protein [Candidatus Paceibacterota bacterium]